MAKRKPQPMGQKQLSFCVEYLKDLNATQAALRAGYSPRSAESQGSRLLSNAKVKAEIQKRMDNRSARVEVKADDILRELLRLGMVDIGQLFDEKMQLKDLHSMPEDARRAISSIEIEEMYAGRGDDRVSIGYLKKVKLYDKPRSLELLGKHLRLFVDKIEIGADESLLDIITAARVEADNRKAAAEAEAAQA